MLSAGFGNAGSEKENVVSNRKLGDNNNNNDGDDGGDVVEGSDETGPKQENARPLRISR